MYTDADMGYGPAVVQNRDEGSVVGGAKSKRGNASSNQGFHPQAPPITVTDTNTAQQGDAVVNFDGNFIMMKKSDTTDGIQEVRVRHILTYVATYRYCLSKTVAWWDHTDHRKTSETLRWEVRVTHLH